MQTSSRLYHCCRCHAQVVICSRCDRGQRYCAGECRHLARIESSQRAAKVWEFILDQIVTCASPDDIPTLEELRERVRESGLL